MARHQCFGREVVENSHVILAAKNSRSDRSYVWLVSTATNFVKTTRSHSINPYQCPNILEPTQLAIELMYRVIGEIFYRKCFDLCNILNSDGDNIQFRGISATSICNKRFVRVLFDRNVSSYSLRRLQWHPLKSEFLKNSGRYHKMVLGHHRGIS